MAQTLQQTKRRPLHGLTSAVFEHATDRAFLNSMKAIPGFGTLVGKAIDFAGNRQQVRLQATGIEVGPSSMPTVWNSFEEACEILRIRPRPKLYVEPGHGATNAYTTGAENPFVVMTDHAVHFLSPAEQVFVLGHELGHVKAGHVKYHTLARILHTGADIASKLTMGLAGVVSIATLGPTLFAWSRRSEFTADRAGLLACQNRDVAIGAMMKLAGYPPNLLGEMRPDQYLEQAAQHRAKLDDSALDRAVNLFEHLQRTHPLWTVRATELADWVSDGSFTEIVESDEAYLNSMAAWINTDPQEQTLLVRAMKTLIDWACQQFTTSREEAGRVIRKMIHCQTSPAGTILEPILRVELHVKRASADAVFYRLAVLVNQGGKALRYSLDVPFVPDWNEVPGEIRQQFIRGGEDSIVRLLYTVGS